MAEGVVGMLIGKLAEALLKESAAVGATILGKEAAALKDLFFQIHESKKELEAMQVYLLDAERSEDTNPTTDVFMKNIREIYFKIEDVVDEFTYKLEDEHKGYTAKIKKRMTSVKTWHGLSQKLLEIRRSLENFDTRKSRYKPEETNRTVGESSGYGRFARQSSLHTVDLVGIKENKKILMEWLSADSGHGRRICTVWGMGGIGKTTLVNHVYDIVKVDFDTVAWINVSKNYDNHVDDLLRKITEEFGILDHDAGLDGGIPLRETGVQVVWHIMNAFPGDNNSTGRFIITSRIRDVALTATGNSVIHLEELGKDHSMELFCNEAFWNKEDKECPPELRDLAYQFLDKCNGLPIAIACIGRLLSCKLETLSEWENVYRMIKSRLTESVIFNVNIILKVSLEDLPYELKNCFMHCLVYPEKSIIKRKRAIRHWISAGFIQKQAQDNLTLEEVAEDYLTELVHRCLLQVVERSAVGRVKSCRMHDVIRILALKKAADECFCKAYDGSTSKPFSVGNTRRLSIQCTNNEELIHFESNETQVREIHVSECSTSLHWLKSILRSSLLLTTLDLQGCTTKELPKEVFNLFNLRYLGLRYTGISELPETIGRLQNLEVLDACKCNLSFFPNNIIKLRRLRFLHACTALGRDKVERFGGVQVPNGIKHLTSLQALQCVKADKGTLGEVRFLTELRTFGVSNVKGEHSTVLCEAISQMNSLVHLEITAIREEVLRLSGLHLPPTLHWLGLEGQLERTSMSQHLPSWSNLTNLTRLKLSFSKLDEESFGSLLPLRSLCRLSLCKAYDGSKLQFSAATFPKLRWLQIWDAPHLNQVTIEEGALPSLDVLRFMDCPNFNILPDGVVHLSTLTELYLKDTAEDLIDKLRGKGESNECDEHHRKINHIKKVTVVLTKNNIEERILYRNFSNSTGKGY
uniref:NB-ARC domain-containing protein n=1 Tax=Leersia perrieri TaxID=77586 RepID=A0A0D9WQ03_9ORYZ